MAEEASPEPLLDDPETDALLSAITAGSIRLESTSDEDGDEVLTTVEPAPVAAFPDQEADLPSSPDQGTDPLLDPASPWKLVSAEAPEASAEASAEPQQPVAQPEPVAAAQPEPVAAAEDAPTPQPATAPQPEAAPSPVPAAAPEASTAQPTPEPAPEAAPQGATIPEQPIIPPNPARVHPTPMHSGPEAQYQKGCLAAAWGDIMQTKGWFGKVLLLGLVGCVPILNFYVNGYAMRWSRELFLGKVAPMPERIFGNRMFVNGFFAFIIGLLLSIVGGLCSALLGAVPIVGAICSVAIYLVIALFQYVAILRTAIADRLGAAFDIAQIWRTCWKNLGALLCATIVPLLIYTAVIFVIVLALMVIVGLPLIGTIAEIGVYGSSSYAAALLSLLGALIPVFIICYILGSFLDAFLTLLTTRATGHYVARYAQDWKTEQAVMSTAHINGI